MRTISLKYREKPLLQKLYDILFVDFSGFAHF